VHQGASDDHLGDLVLLLRGQPRIAARLPTQLETLDAHLVEDLVSLADEAVRHPELVRNLTDDFTPLEHRQRKYPTSFKFWLGTSSWCASGICHN